MSSKISRRDWIIGIGLGAAGIAAASGLYTARDDIANLLGSSKPAAEKSGLETAVKEAPAQQETKPKQQVLEITRDNYRDVLGLDIKDKAELASRPPMVIMFSSDGCPPCKVVAPVFEKVAEMYKREDVSFAHYKANFNSPGTKYFKPDRPTEIPIIEDWDVCGVPDVALLYKGELKWNKNGRPLSPMWGDNGVDGVTGFKNLVEDLLKQYCGDCSYLKRRAE